MGSGCSVIPSIPQEQIKEYLRELGKKHGMPYYVINQIGQSGEFHGPWSETHYSEILHVLFSYPYLIDIQVGRPKENQCRRILLQ
jgi:hypothetical protein